MCFVSLARFKTEINLSRYFHNLLVLPKVRILSVRETNELSKYRERLISVLNRKFLVFTDFYLRTFKMFLPSFCCLSIGMSSNDIKQYLQLLASTNVQIILQATNIHEHPFQHQKCLLIHSCDLQESIDINRRHDLFAV